MKGNPPTRPSFSPYTAISRKVVGKSARDNQKFERLARAAMDVCLRVLKESNKSRFDSYSVRNSVLIISHITFLDCRVLIFFSGNLSRNSCKHFGSTSLSSFKARQSEHARALLLCRAKGLPFFSYKSSVKLTGRVILFPGTFFLRINGPLVD